MSEDPYFDIDSIGLFSRTLSFFLSLVVEDVKPVGLLDKDLFFKVDALLLLEGGLLLSVWVGLLLVMIH